MLASVVLALALTRAPAAKPRGLTAAELAESARVAGVAVADLDPKHSFAADALGPHTRVLAIAADCSLTVVRAGKLIGHTDGADPLEGCRVRLFGIEDVDRDGRLDVVAVIKTSAMRVTEDGRREAYSFDAGALLLQQPDGTFVDATGRLEPERLGHPPSLSLRDVAKAFVPAPKQ